MISRRRTREYLLQMLYARANTPGAFDRDIFFSAYFQQEDTPTLDQKYLINVEGKILSHETEILNIIARLAPKFEIDTIPTIHVLILMIALAEMLYGYEPEEAIPENVSINEAIELAKRFSDENGKSFINGALSTFLKKKNELLPLKNESTFRLFA